MCIYKYLLEEHEVKYSIYHYDHCGKVQAIEKLYRQSLTSFIIDRQAHILAHRPKVLDLLDLFVTKGLNYLFTGIESSLDGLSDHILVFLTMSLTVVSCEGTMLLHYRKTNWEGFCTYLNEHINMRLLLETTNDIEEACKLLIYTVQVAAWQNTPSTHKVSDSIIFQPVELKNKIAEKRRLRQNWQLS